VAEFPILRGSHTLQSEQSQPNLAYLADAPSRFGSQTVPTVYKRWTKGPRTLLWFSKTGDRHVEDAYARHFFSPSTETHLCEGDRRDGR
jgi:hypothetical protein